MCLTNPDYKNTYSGGDGPALAMQSALRPATSDRSAAFFAPSGELVSICFLHRSHMF